MLHHLLFLKPSIEGVSVTTENLVFKLIYGVTCPLFLAFGVIFYTRICFLDPINCVSNTTESFKVLRAIDSFCLENSYIYYDESSNLSPIQETESVFVEVWDDTTSNRLYQRNYQYVGIFFVICGALCYLPYVLWEWFENGLLKSLLQDLMSIIVPVEADAKRSRIQQINNLLHFWKKNPKALETYAIANIFCELLNLICVLLIFTLSDYFLGGNFATFGITSDNNKITAFPKSANCSWSTVGPGGKPVSYEGVCTMNLNYLSEKMFYFSWWWIATTATLCAANIVYRYAIFRNPELRSSIIIPNKEQLKTFENYLKEMNYGEFFMIKRIQANVMPDTFQEILTHFYANSTKSDKKEE